MAAPDLITQGYLTSVFDATTLTAAQVAALPALTTAASRGVRTYCNRYFSRRTVDELYSVVSNRRSVVLKEYPVNAVLRFATGPVSVLSLGVTDTTTNQRATATLATTGDVDAGLVVTGLTLWRIASGVVATSTVLFSACPTLAAVAAAVIAQGGSWTALAAAPYALWPSADLRAVQSGQPALGQAAATLVLHTTDLAFDLDGPSGIVRFAPPSGPASDPFNSPRWGPYGSPGDDDSGAPGFLGVRVVADIGFDVIPADVQLLVAMAVKSWAEQMVTDSTLASESGGVDSSSYRALISLLPQAVRDGLAPWRNVRG
jgi:hypothetical protein